MIKEMNKLYFFKIFLDSRRSVILSVIAELYRAWRNLLEFLGDPKYWGPWGKKYREAFWKPLTYRTRLYIANFCYQNGVYVGWVLSQMFEEAADLDQ